MSRAPLTPPTRPAPTLDTVAGLLAIVAAAPAPVRDHARDRIDRAMAGDARRCRALLGELALELAPAVTSHRVEELVVVLDLDGGPTRFALPARVPSAATAPTALTA